MGAHLVNLAAERGFGVVVTSRKEMPSNKLVKYVQGNARDDNFLRELLFERWDVIVDFMVYTTEVFKHRAKLFLAATDQYVYLSSARVYADSVEPITEASKRLLDVSTDREYLATDEYALAKARQENVLFNSGMGNWTIIRPYITYSEDRLQLGVFEKEAWLYRAVCGRSIVFSSDISLRTTTLTYGLDVARGILSLIGNRTALGEAYHITFNKGIKWGSVLSIYSDVLENQFGRRPNTKLLELIKFEKLHSAKHQIIYDRLYDRCFDNTKVSRFLDLNSFTDPEEGLRQCLMSFLQAPTFLEIDWKMEARKDRQVGDRSSFAKISGLRNRIKYLLYRYIN